jgi:hypothetical protein
MSFLISKETIITKKSANKKAHKNSCGIFTKKSKSIPKTNDTQRKNNILDELIFRLWLDLKLLKNYYSDGIILVAVSHPPT